MIALRHALLIVLLNTSVSLAVITSTDVSVKLGTATGTVYEQSNDGSIKSYGFGGFPINLTLNAVQFEKFYINFGLGVIADLVNFQITRGGLHGEFAYHLLGESRIRVSENDTIKEIERSPYNLSLGTRLSINHYEASKLLANQTLAKISASVLELAGGVEYRFDISESASCAIELYSSLFVLGVGNSQVRPNLMELWISYRFFL